MAPTLPKTQHDSGLDTDQTEGLNGHTPGDAKVNVRGAQVIAGSHDVKKTQRVGGKAPPKHPSPGKPGKLTRYLDGEPELDPPDCH